MFTLESFCNSVWDKSYLKVRLDIKKDGYKSFSLAKAGGARTIHYLEKDSPLGGLQRKLLDNFLRNQVTPVCVKGFKKYESYRTYLAPHCGAGFFLRLDIKSFFPSVNAALVRDAFSSLIVCQSPDEEAKLLELVCDIVTLNGVLPQGACTSPAVSNLVMARLDQRILKYCQVFDVTYTRYADDLLFSSGSFDFSAKGWFLKKIKHILSSGGFRLNYDKLKYGRGELCLNGYIVGARGLRLSRNRLSDIRHILAFCKKNRPNGAWDEGDFLEKLNALPLAHRDLTRYPFGSLFGLTQYLCGYRAFLIGWVDGAALDDPFQKSLQRLIRKIELEILAFS